MKKFSVVFVAFLILSFGISGFYFVVYGEESLNKADANLNECTLGGVNVEWYGAKGDGVKDDTIAIQAAISSADSIGGATVIFPPRQTFCISSTIFIPNTVDIDFQDSTIKAIGGGTFTKNYMFAINSKECFTWDFPYYPRYGFFKNVKLDGNQISNIRGIFIGSRHRLKGIDTKYLYNVITTPKVYIDNFWLEDVHMVHPQGSDYQIYKPGWGEGLYINKIEAPVSITKLIKLSGCGGGIISNIINGTISLTDCYSMTITNWHNELGNLYLYNSFVTLKDSIIYKRNEITDSPIVIRDGDYSIGGFKKSKPIVLENVIFNIYYYLSDYLTDLADIDVSYFKGVLQLENVYRRVANRSVVQTVACGISIYDGTNIFFCKDNQATIKNKKLLIPRLENIAPITSSYFMGIDSDSYLIWRAASGTYYYGICLVYDTERSIGGWISTEKSFSTINGSNGADIVLGEQDTPALLRLYRGTSSKHYTQYVDIPNPMSMLFDNGVSVNGFAWKDTGSTITDLTTIVNNNISGFMEIKSSSVICQGTSIPTIGVWSIGDIIYNTIPAAGGYIGWVCVTAGTPGTWKGFGTIQP